jgi:hypothetical protein
MRRLRKLKGRRDQLLDRWVKARPEDRQRLLLQWIRLNEEIEEALQRK